MRCDECNVDGVRNDMHYECPECGLIHSPILENKLADRHRDNNKLGSVIGKEKGSYKLRRLALTSKMSSEDRSMKKVQFYQSILVSEFSMCETCRITINDYYIKLKGKHVFTSNMSLEERIAAIGYIVLKEYNYSYTLLEVSKILEIPSKKISKLSRLFARSLSKSYVFSNNNVTSLIEKFCLQLNKSRKFISDCVNLYSYLDNIDSRYPTSAYLAGIIYCVETTQLSKSSTQKDVANVFGIKQLAVRNNYKKILSKLNIKDTFGLTIEDIIEGIRWRGQEV